MLIISETLAQELVSIEDAIEAVIADSLEPEWTPRRAARPRTSP